MITIVVKLGETELARTIVDSTQGIAVVHLDPEKIAQVVAEPLSEVIMENLREHWRTR